MASRKAVRSPGIHKRVGKGFFRLFVPHRGNGFKPHLIRPIGLVVVLALVSGLIIFADAPDAGSVKGVAADFSRDALLLESNKARSENNLPSLRLDDSLNSAAGLKARDMLVRQYWDHTAPDGTTPWFWFREVNYRYDYAGENLAKGFETSAGVVTAWMNSEEHRKNALSGDYQDVGFGVAEGTLDGKQTTVVVAMYGSVVGAPAVAAPEVLAASDGQLSLIARFGIGLQSLSPVVLGSIVLLLVTGLVALFAHAYRRMLPPTMQKSWKRHHGLIKAAGMSGLILLLITLYGGGQIL